MKTVLTIWVLILVGVHVNGQNKNTVTPTLSSRHIEMEEYLPVSFKQQLQLEKVIHKPILSRFKTETIDKPTLDSVIVHSVYNLPKRYTYLYDSAGNCIRKRIQTKMNDLWVNKTQDTIVYDSLGNAILKTWQNWDTNAWIYSVRTLSKYNNNLLLAAKNQSWQNGTWVNTDSSSYNYNQSQNIVSYLQKIWADNKWVNNVYQLYIYDSTNSLTDVYRTVWKDTVWANDQHYNYLYDSLGNVVTALIEKGIYQGWEYLYKEDYTYDSAGNRTSYVGMLWEDGSDSTWVNSERYFYTYNSSGYLTSAMGQTWLINDSAWENTYRAQYTYNQFGGEESALVQYWSDTVWSDTTLTQYIFDALGNTLKGDYYTISNQTWGQDEDGVLRVTYNFSPEPEYFTGYHVDAFYKKDSTATGIPSVKGKQQVVSFSVMPNPTHGELAAQIITKRNEKIVLNLFTLTGSKLQTLYSGILSAGKHTIDLNMNNYPDGMYFICLNTNARYQTVKIIKSK